MRHSSEGKILLAINSMRHGNSGKSIAEFIAAAQIDPITGKSMKGKFRHWASVASFFSFAGGLAFAALILFFQVIGWLKTGIWPNISLGSVVSPALENSQFASWMVDPHSWIGLRSAVLILLKIPLAAWVVISTIFITRVLQDLSEGSS